MHTHFTLVHLLLCEHSQRWNVRYEISHQNSLHQGTKKVASTTWMKEEPPSKHASVKAQQDRSSMALTSTSSGHFCHGRVSKNHMMAGLDPGQLLPVGLCKLCTNGKSHRIPLNHSGRKRAGQTLKLVNRLVKHSNSWTVMAVGRGEYFVTRIHWWLHTLCVDLYPATQEWSALAFSRVESWSGEDNRKTGKDSSI